MRIGLSQAKSVVRGVFQAIGDISCIPHHLFGNAAEIHTGSTQLARLDDGHLRAVFRRPLRSGEPTAAAPYHHQIELVGHTHPSLRTSNSASMVHGAAPLAPKGSVKP